MNQQVIIIWKSSPTSHLLQVRATEEGSPELLDVENVTERVISSQMDLVEYIHSDSTEHVAVTAHLAHSVLGWDL